MIVWHTTKRPLAENTVGSGVETNSISRVAETTALVHWADKFITCFSDLIKQAYPLV